MTTLITRCFGLAGLILLLHVGRAGACPELPIPPDAANPYELQFGATNVNAALGSGALTAGFSPCGELTVFKWPGPSYYNLLNYIASNSPDAHLLPHLGALDDMGAFPGLYYTTEQSNLAVLGRGGSDEEDGVGVVHPVKVARSGFTWLRDSEYPLVCD